VPRPRGGRAGPTAGIRWARTHPPPHRRLFTLRAAEEVRAAQFGMAEGELDAENCGPPQRIAVSSGGIGPAIGELQGGMTSSRPSSVPRSARLCKVSKWGMSALARNAAGTRFAVVGTPHSSLEALKLIGGRRAGAVGNPCCWITSATA
jgi:hypothetical protein